MQLEELWTLDDETLTALNETSKIHGLIFLFQWQQKPSSGASDESKKEPLAEDQIPNGLYFAHQVTTNACGTQAILSVVLNSCSDKEDLGQTLTDFREFTAEFPPSLKGELCRVLRGNDGIC